MARLKKRSTLRSSSGSYRAADYLAGFLLALVTLPAQAQMGGMGKRGGGGGETKTDDKKPKVDEKAYKDALKRIPEPKEKYDPWGGARPSDAATKSK